MCIKKIVFLVLSNAPVKIIIDINKKYKKNWKVVKEQCHRLCIRYVQALYVHVIAWNSHFGKKTPGK